MNENLSIGAASRNCGVKVPTIRYYEQIGLLPPPPRTEGNRRTFNARDLRRLAFIRHARELGFPLQAIKELLSLSDRPDQSCERVDHVARDVLADVEAKLERLEALRGELRRMIRQCRHGRVSECRVIRVLADHSHSNCLSKGHE